MPKWISFEMQEEFFDLVCGGAPITHAADWSGVSHDTATRWWRERGVMGLELAIGARGGLPGTAPLRRPGEERAGRQRRPLTGEDRAVIAALHHRKVSMREIGRCVGRDVSVISREVARNSGPDGSYHGPVAHRAAHERRRRPKGFKLHDSALGASIESWMDDGWSPGLIAAMLREQHPRTKMARVSHETIYRALYVQARGSLRKDLAAQLLTKRRARKPRGSVDGRGKSLYREAFTISQRPAEVADRAVPGHWEGDLILGTGNGSAVGTLVERTTRFVILLHLPERHDAASVAEAMIREMTRLPEHLRRSLTWDRGSELANYRDIEAALDMPVYFCDPHSPWQRGSNENTNRLLRFWLEKGTDLSIHTADDLARIAATLNKRPRPTLDLQTPAQALAELLANPAAA
ncbi:IS30 family transposase [Nocardioides sp.]|uniref:IS30 family transposase n=1 Tax=Nocardioides sp. TaxID=35761 RepID=UPI002BFCD726|nr:IS30 family transposase [Nocardioides sp.]HXH77429.1 IS30 family transposase [Nocardioides sp.]